MPVSIACVLIIFSIFLSLSSTEAIADFYRESPQLTAMTEKGDLPPVERRLPKAPLVVPPHERIGTYGGTWRMAMVGNQDGALLYRTMGYEHLVRWDPAWTKVLPNLAQTYRVNADATEFTFTLREGLRWSDGHPFTAEDIAFWYHDVLSNPDLTPEPPAWLTSDGKLVGFEARGPFEVVFRFAAPNSLFLHRLASAKEELSPARYPMHWMKRFHIRHNPDGIQAEIERANARDWVELFNLKNGTLGKQTHIAPLFRVEIGERAGGVPDDFEPWPTLNAWSLVGEETAGGETSLIAIRNPYYWKIDTAGQQLPYIDRLRFTVVETTDQAMGLARAGRIDMQARRISQHRGLIKSLIESDAIRVFSLIEADANTVPLAFNQTHSDPEKRRLFGRLAFRVALSLAIDRKAIIDKVYSGEGMPYQVAPRPQSRYYHDRLARQFLEFDPARANALLDDMGLTQRDADGFRRMPNGRRVSLTISVRPDNVTQRDAVAMVTGYWRKIGIDAMMREISRKELYGMVQNQTHDVVVSQPDGGMEAMLAPENYLPAGPSSDFGIGWVRWSKDPADSGAVEPPADVKRQIDLYESLSRETAPRRQDQIARAILDISADRLDVIGISLRPDAWGVLSDRMRNVPRVIIAAWTYPTPAPTNTCQYFLDGAD